MSRQLFYHIGVESDLASAKKWYKLQQAGLEKRFAAEVKKALKKLQAEPLLYEVRYRDIRIKHLDVFPFGIHYHINKSANTIIIIGILHQHQNPETYYNRQEID